ncbi:MAG: tetratricopeptide repeat protein [Gammaproteobacteria bacterium]|nr:tetratricopeptide repeat protein [Gammaproteobacteria bacterium]
MTPSSTAPVGKRSVIDILCELLEAEKTDLTQLMLPINRKKAAKQQIPAIIRQAYRRLGELRNDVDQLVEMTSDAESTRDIHTLLTEAQSMLHVDAPFSLEATSIVLESAIRRSNPTTVPNHISAPLAAARALSAALEQNHQVAVESYEAAAQTEGLKQEQQWHYQILKASILEDLGRDFGVNHALDRAAKMLEDETLFLAPKDTRPEAWATTMQKLGNVLGIMGQRQSGTRNLEVSIAKLEASLKVRDRTKAPLLWAETHNSLGTALGILGHRHKDEPMLKRCVASFELALEERTREVSPHDWATTKNNLAAVLQSIGQKNKDTTLLKQAVDAYREVLEEWTRERAPLDWSSAMNNLGTGLRLLGEHRKGPRTLEQSVAAYNSALSERSREQHPVEWAMTQNNLGAALQKLAEKESDAETMQKAIYAYENALKEWTRDRAPMSWSMTTANLGVARRTLAEVTNDYQAAIKAVEELDAVSDAFREASHAQYSELIIDQLAQARKLADSLLDKQRGNHRAGPILTPFFHFTLA